MQNLMDFRLTPSLASDGGEAWAAALLLLAPMRASLTSEEMASLVSLIRASSDGQIQRGLASMERPNAYSVASALTTRFGRVSGMNEAQQVALAAARYVDTEEVMPPEVALYKPGWLTSLVTALLPGVSLTDWGNKAMDLWDGVFLRTTPEYDVDVPPSFLGGDNAPGYRKGLYTALTTNIVPEQKPGTDE